MIEKQLALSNQHQNQELKLMLKMHVLQREREWKKKVQTQQTVESSDYKKR